MPTTTTSKPRKAPAKRAPRADTNGHTPPAAEPTLEMILVERIDFDEHNVRARERLDNLDKGFLTSIRELGILEPLVVAPHPTRTGRYVLRYGHRRLAGAAAVNLDVVPCIVRTDALGTVAQLVENLQREDLTPIEEARGYQRLVERDGMSQRTIAAKVGRNQSHISKRLALLELPDKWQAEVDAGGIAIEQALELGRLHDHPGHISTALDKARSLARNYGLDTPSLGNVKVAVDRTLEAIDVARRRQEEINQLVETGVRVLDYPELGVSAIKGVRELQAYRWPGKMPTRAALKKAGHLAATVDTHADVRWLCTSPATYERNRSAGTGNGRVDDAKAKAAKTRAENKIKRAERDVRVAALKTWLDAAKADTLDLLGARISADAKFGTPVAELVDAALATMLERNVVTDGMKVAATLLGHDPKTASMAFLRDIARRPGWEFKAAVAHLTATAEVSIADSWRAEYRYAVGPYLELLESIGHHLTPNELKLRAKAGT